MISSPAPTPNPNPNTPYYVIIGCGFSGILNHVLLRRSPVPRPGSGLLPILHIGRPDPWGNYHRGMPMGQWPTLLTLPGFHKKPSTLSRSANLRCEEFARLNKFEWNWLAKNYPFYYRNGRVTAIRESATTKDRYEVIVDDKDIYQADYIDVCGGPGPARTPDLTEIRIDSTLLREFDGAAGPDGWPRLVSGENFLSAKRRRAVPAKHEICVYGGGPTGAWCVEHAQTLRHKVHWVAKEELNSAFVASRRNDGLLRDEVIRRNVGGDQVVTGRLRPRNSSTVFGENLAATEIKPTAGGGVEISFVPAASATWRFTRRSGRLPIKPPIVRTLPVHQVVLSIGQETSYKEDHSWASLLKPVFDEAIRLGKNLIVDDHGRVVGLQSDDERVRLLGAAALAHPTVAAEWKNPRSPSNLFFRSLVEQARVPIGITVSAIAVAEANRFWFGAVNYNLNTCEIRDLDQLTASWPPGLLGAETWFSTRGHRIPPFTTREFRNLARFKISY